MRTKPILQAMFVRTSKQNPKRIWIYHSDHNGSV
jgi:hypothetical protein